MKACPFCAEEIQDAAVKCKHCGELLNAGASQGVTAAGLAGAVNVNAGGNSLLRALGGVLLFCGGVAWAYFFFAFDSSVAAPGFGETERIHNIGLMQTKQQGTYISGSVGGLGIVLLILAQFVRDSPVHRATGRAIRLLFYAAMIVCFAYYLVKMLDASKGVGGG